MVSTHAASVLKEKCEVLAAEWQALFQQNLHPVDTVNDPFFEFLAFHFSMYNRYHEDVSNFRFLALLHLTDILLGGRGTFRCPSRSTH